MIFNANMANALIVALTNLNAILAGEGEEYKIVNYLTFSERGDENVDDFIVELEKTFAVNRIFDNKKHVIIASYLKGTAANFYNELAGIMG